MSEQLLTRIAQMESELAQLRGGQRQPSFDKKAFLLDPNGYLARQGLSQDEMVHVNRVNLAAAMGDQAPQEMKYLAQLGPQIAQTSALATAIENLSRRFDELVVAPKSKEATVTSLKALIADQVKYPHFSKAFAADPSLLESKMNGRTGTAEELAQSFESEATAFAKAFGVTAQPASEDAGSKDAQSQQSKPAPLIGGPSGDVPSLPKPSGGPLTPEEDQAIKAALARKYGFSIE